MLSVEFNAAIAGYFLLTIVPLILFWVLLRDHGIRSFKPEKKFVWTCLTCTYTYITTKDDKYSVCPKCGFMNERTGDEK